MKLTGYLLGAIVSFLFVGCNNSSSGSSPAYGSLSSYTLARTIITQDVTDEAYERICKGYGVSSSECQSNLANLNSDFGFTISQIQNNTSGVSSIDAYNITYLTQGFSTDGALNYVPKTVSGTVYIPRISTSDVKGIILYYHPTMYNVNDYSPAANIENTTAADFAGLYASQGYIVVLSDLLGFGVDSNEMHPYVYPKINVMAGVNMLKATSTLFKNIGLNLPEQPLIVNGFSEGGMLTQWASYMIQNNEVSLLGTNTHLSMTIPMAGAFDLSGIQVPMEYANVSTANNTYKIHSDYVAALAKPGLAAYSVNSFLYYNPAYSCTDILKSALCNFTYNGSQTSISAFFAIQSTTPDTMEIQDTIYQAAQTLGFATNNNSANIYMQSSVLPAYTNTVYSVNLTHWTTTTPITYIHLAEDSLLSPLNSINNYNNMLQTSNPSLIRRKEIQNSNYVFYQNGAQQTIDHNNYIQYIATIWALNNR